ncbi:hypothetical protein L227DRAFT_357796 [Lentinus tigrinus ALCF2SS1-6]|uniref:Uncharacterized protein n=1 Tax=Lentinus tigrinus ALCF2SS1-6 TaxID=1328759 RepID=A0A5C2SK53_9APHY|nr:hypothetical protein L227DRAFT_357796 [Lentinus tigrinus ALCF2SS1-6]
MLCDRSMFRRLSPGRMARNTIVSYPMRSNLLRLRVPSAAPRTKRHRPAHAIDEVDNSQRQVYKAPHFLELTSDSFSQPSSPLSPAELRLQAKDGPLSSSKHTPHHSPLPLLSQTNFSRRRSPSTPPGLGERVHQDPPP